MISIKLKKDDVRALIITLKQREPAIRKATYKELYIGGRLIESEAKQIVPQRTNRLQTSITTIGSEQQLKVEVYTNVVYAKAVEYGLPARTLTIKAKNKKVLAAPAKGYKGFINDKGLPALSKNGQFVIFGKQVTVNLPARKPKPYMKPAYEKVKPSIIANLKQMLNNA